MGGRLGAGAHTNLWAVAEAVAIADLVGVWTVHDIDNDKSSDRGMSHK